MEKTRKKGYTPEENDAREPAKRSDLGVVAAVLAVAALFLVLTLELPKEAQVYPLFILGLLTALTLGFLGKVLVQGKRNGWIPGMEAFRDFETKQFLIVLAATLLYLVLIRFFGFWIASACYILASLLVLKVPKWQIVPVVACILLLVYLAFTRFLGVGMPLGSLLHF